MTEFIFNGIIDVTTENKDAFIENFKKFLDSQQSSFKGTIRANEYDDVEIIDG